MRPRRPEELGVGQGPADIPYDRSNMAEGISGIPAAIGGMKKMSLEFSEPSAPEAPQIPQGAGVPPAGMADAAIPPSGMAPQQPMQNSLLAGVGQPQVPDSSMFSDQDLMSMVGQDFDPMDAAGEDMFNGLMGGDPMIQQQLMMAARRGLGGR